MDGVQRCHDVLLQQRTQIRHHSAVLLWMKRCWKAAARADAHAMTRDEFEDLYSVLLYEMTICWEEELNDAVLCKLWQRDAASHDTLNGDRFGCSMFAFVEMWVEEITLAEYEKIFCHVYRILSGLDAQHGASAASSALPASYKPRTFKPTLESFSNALDNERAMEELQMSFGKSVSFDAQQYYQHFGTPTTHLQAFQATLLHLQSRVHIDRDRDRDRDDADRDVGGSEGGRGDASLRTRRRSPAERQPQRPDTRSGRSPERRSASPTRLTSPLLMTKPASSSSSGRARYVLTVNSHASAAPQASPNPPRGGSGGDSFLLAGRSVLASRSPGT